MRFEKTIMLVCLALATICAGCSNANPQGRKAIEGSVTLDGAPLATGYINFEPIGSQSERTSCGAEIKEGKYSITASEGLVPGEYGVSLSSRQASTPPPGVNPMQAKIESVDLVPPEFGSESKQKVTVTDSKIQTFDFHM
ncbi:MAG: hypothetical protein Q4G68_06205 [Planctomycetia bacterium]|nr:hypothetical protein [Planctomycetia bacterium]